MIEPVLMGIFLCGLSHSVSRDNIIDFTYWIPFSKRRRMIKRLTRPFILYSKEGMQQIPDDEYNDIIRKHALNLFDGNEQSARYWLQADTASLKQV